MDTQSKQAEPGNMTIMPHAAQAFGKRFGFRGKAPAAAEQSEDRVDFQVIYRKAGLPGVSFTAEEMIDMLGSLSPDLAPHTKKHTVAVTLKALGKAIGASPETICGDGTRKREALAAKIEKTNAETQEFTATTERDIAGLQAQIAEKQGAITAAKHRQATIVDACSSESNRLGEMLNFFEHRERPRPAE
jgi:hypothetical protein